MPKKSKGQFYKMKGCSKSRTRKKYLGGSIDVPVAYPSTGINTLNNTSLAFDPSHDPNTQYMPSNSNSNNYSNYNSPNPGINLDRAYPVRAPPAMGFNFLNSQSGGGDQSYINKMLGGSRKHRKGCCCSFCKKKKSKTKKMRGGSCSSNGGLPYPNGLLGDAWSPNLTGWPGVDGVAMNRSHLGYNTYDNDVSRQMLDVGANPPFTYMKGGKRMRKKTRRLRGGTLSNFLGQDVINLGRQFKYNGASAWNALRGNQNTANPLPWKDQMARIPSAPS
uniref:Uncharacterized protein n=1 Tax=viral metagenome TaxID=1070528 RepID=A0A6C0LJD9_9ZZZZ